MRKPIHVPSEQWLYLGSDRHNERLAIFVHGYGGNYLGTWGNLADLLTRHADDDEEFARWDFLFVGFDTDKVETYLDVAAGLRRFVIAALAGNHPFTARPYRRLVITGHSLGTLGIRQLLCAESSMPDKWRDAIGGLCFICPVQDGSGLAPFGKVLQRRPIASSLQFHNPQLRMLREWAKDIYHLHGSPRLRILMAQDDGVTGDVRRVFAGWPGDPEPTVVSVSSGNWHIRFLRELNRIAQHIQLAKVDAWDDSSVIGVIKDTLREAA